MDTGGGGLRRLISVKRDVEVLRIHIKYRKGQSIDEDIFWTPLFSFRVFGSVYMFFFQGQEGRNEEFGVELWMEIGVLELLLVLLRVGGINC